MTTLAEMAFLCDGFLHFSNLVLTPKLDRIHLLRDAYRDVLLLDGRWILRRLPDLRRDLLHLLLHSGICHTAGESPSRFLLQLDELERQS